MPRPPVLQPDHEHSGGINGEATVNLPGSLGAGNLILIQVMAENEDLTNNPVIDTPTGYTEFVPAASSTSGNRVSSALFVKRATSSEPANFLLTGNWDDCDVVAARVTGQRETSPISASVAQGAGNSDTPNVPGPLAVPDDECLLLFLDGIEFNVNEHTPPAGMTERWDVFSSRTLFCATEELGAAGNVSSRQATATFSGRWTAALVAIAPAAHRGAPAVLATRRY